MSALAPRFSPTRILGVVALAVVVLAPTGLILYQSLLDQPFYAVGTHFSLESFGFVMEDPDFWSALRNSLLLGVIMVAVAVPVGAMLAFIMMRTDLPGRSWIEPILLLPLFLSPLVLAFGYIVTIGPVGFISGAVKAYIGFVPWSIYSFLGMALIAGFTHVPHVYLYVASALRRVNPDVEEAARVAGAGMLRTALFVSLPLVRPALVYAAMLIFLLGLEQFGLPLMLGDPSGIGVLTTYLYKLTNILGTPSYNFMAVVAVVILASTLPLVVLQRFVLRNASHYVTLRGKGARDMTMRLGKWRWPALAIILVWLGLTVLVPLAGIMIRSVVSSWGVGVSLIDVLTLQHFRDLASYPNLIEAILNTLGVAVIGGFASVAIYAGVALLAHRWVSGWTVVLDYLVMLPRALPGLVAGLAFLWLFLFVKPIDPLRGTILSIWVAYTVVWLAYGLRLISSALMQIGPELEEAARVAGAGAGRAIRDVTLPLVRTGLIGAWLLIFLIFAREYSTGVYLLGPHSVVIGSMIVQLWSKGALDLIAALCVANVALIFLGLAVAFHFRIRLHD
ncbi:MAG TPA: iron ABC transporter permease [Stellaceae bacterium]|nr:iron ABC transporter permease [Stellaceae bacterium]